MLQTMLARFAHRVVVAACCVLIALGAFLLPPQRVVTAEGTTATPVPTLTPTPSNPSTDGGDGHEE